MTLLQLGLEAVAALLVVSWVLVAYYKWRAVRTQGENREIKQEIDRVKQQSAVIKTQLNNQRVRQKNEKDINSRNRSELINSLSASGDLRD
jgi:hypothetical protein|nr:MAG TPA: Protein of unknown function (DUF2681) [Caudoviricetes sp.]